MGAPLLPETIQTPRTVLRPFRFEDVDDVLAYAGDEEWGRYLIGIPQPYRRSDAAQFLARQALLDRSEHPTWAIAIDGRAVGGINIRFRSEWLIAEMGWSIDRRLWGRGLATEAARAVIDHAFRTHARLDRIAATADPRNVGSVRVMEKLGMQREGVLRRSRFARGELRDEVYCALLRSEWEASL